jgi:hypothetical protein
MLPDYSALFHRDTVRPLRFRVRGGANHVHDIQFLSSYLHDPRFAPGAVVRRGKKLLMEVDRDCWEFGFTEQPGSLELHTARARLTLGPVSSVRWEADVPLCVERELWIERVYLGVAHWETPEVSEIVISAPHAGWRLCISLADDFGEIRLNDLEAPRLHSTRKP